MPDPLESVLLIDVGNSRVKWAVFDGESLRAPQAAEHEGMPGELLGTVDLPLTEAVWVCNVTGEAHEGPIADAVDERCGARAQFARVQRNWSGLRVAYGEPERLGVDRWLSMAAVWVELEKPFCVVNAGTALTYDEVRRAGRHAGGLIAPGLTTAQTAVRDNTRFTIRPSPEDWSEDLGTDTESCVRQGALYACVGMVERAAREVLGPKVLTGGDAPVLQRYLGRSWILRPHLVLEGLLAYARYEAGWRR